MSSDLQTTVCLDGAAVRRIREEKKLTQLYVAKVVGVTTDTVSRWENNRYPTIKRENALRLTEALEVPLQEIQRQQEPEAVAAEPASPRRDRRIFIALALLFSIFSALGYVLLRSGDGLPPGVEAERRLPPHAAPGTVLPVRVWLATEGTKGYILREHFPPGWKLIEASPPASSLDNEEGTARWIIKGGSPRQLVAYLLRLDPNAVPGKEGSFRGEIVASPDGSRPAPVAGETTVRVAPHLWADLNGDGSVDDGEMLQASDTFEEMQGVHLDWDLLEAIWDAGGYRWQKEERRFIPARPPALKNAIPGNFRPSPSPEKPDRKPD